MLARRERARYIRGGMIVLGIETSCDETAVALVTAERQILANLVLSQIGEHAAFGGVVPEIAARAHLDHLDALIRGALAESGVGFRDLGGIAATCGPGLIGGLIVGMMAGKALAAAWDLPFAAINHLEAHALTARLTASVEFPYLLLLVSGGHTQLLIAEDVGTYRVLGGTVDDAAGECFDKSAKLLGLLFPGGPNLEKAARDCADPERASARFPLPRPMSGRKGCDFSFSGLKTAVRNHVEKAPGSLLKTQDIADLACALETAVAETLADRVARAMEIFLERYGNAPLTRQAQPADLSPGGRGGAPALVVAGGVAANLKIRERLGALAAEKGFALHAPPLKLCGDNAAMVAWAGVERLGRGLADGLDFAARPRWPLDEARAGKTGQG